MNTRVPAAHDPREEAGTRHGCAPHGRTTFLVQEDRLTVGAFETSSARTRQNFLFQLALHTNGALAGRRGHEIAQADCETSQISGGIISQRGFGTFLQIACKLLAPKEAQ
jgi:hypothetical protein